MLTGINILNIELVAKQLELLRELLPRAAHVAVLVNPANPTSTESTLKAVEAAAHSLELQIKILRAGNSGESNAAFANIAQERPDALFVYQDGLFNAGVTGSSSDSPPYASPHLRDTRAPQAGGLMSYGSNVMDAYRQVGNYTGRILKGTSLQTCRSYSPSNSS